MTIRKAELYDLARIAEIEVFNYRLNFYHIFQNDYFYFHEMQVLNVINEDKRHLDQLWVYDDDGIIKAFMWVDAQQIKKLFVEPVLQSQGIGSELLTYAVKELERHVDDAVKALEVLPDSYEKECLVALAHYTGKRNK